LLINLSWTIHGIHDPFPAILLKSLWPINKTNLVPIRLVHFLALAIVTVHLVSADSRFLRWRMTRPIVLCGQHSLQVFCLGILLSVLGHFALTEWSGGLPMQIAVNVIGFASMIATAALITWYRAMERNEAAGSQPRVRPLGSP
jgi:hypothetical protein